MSRCFAEVSKAWKGTTADIETCSDNSRQCYDARGNGNGATVPTLTGDHENRVTDYTAVVVAYNEETITNKTNKSNPQDGDPCCTLCATGAARTLLVVGADMYNQTTTGDKASTVTSGATDPHHIPCAVKCYAIGNGQADQTGLHKLVGALNCMHDQQAILLCYCLQGNSIDRSDKSGCEGKGVAEDVSYTLNTIDRHAVGVIYAIDQGGGKSGANVTKDLAPTLACTHGGEPAVVYSEVYALDSLAANSMKSDNPHSGIHKTDIARCLDTAVPDPSKNQGGNAICQVVNARLIVRRLTPTECARLQGMPDWWAKDIPHSDSAEYKMWGNGMALPNILYVMEGLKEFAEDTA